MTITTPITATWSNEQPDILAAIVEVRDRIMGEMMVPMHLLEAELAFARRQVEIFYNGPHEVEFESINYII